MNNATVKANSLLNTMKETVTYSELRARRRCAYRGHLEYDQLIVPRRRKAGFREGSIADAGMNALYLHLRDHGTYSLEAMLGAMREERAKEDARLSRAGLFDEEWQEIEERYELLEALAERYVIWADACDDFTVFDCQSAGRVPVLTTEGRASTRFDFLFKLDGLVEADGKLWLLENKWWKSWDRNRLTALQMDEQSGMYLWGFLEAARRGLLSPRAQGAVERCGLPVGVYYNVVRKKLPTVPPQLKDGSTSRKKDIDTTAEVYLATLAERGQDPADYAEIVDLLQAKGNTFYYRERIYRNAAELAEIGRRIYEGTRLIAEGHRYKFPTKDCTWDCSYWSLCLEWNDMLLAEHFDRKLAKHEEYADMEEAA